MTCTCSKCRQVLSSRCVEKRWPSQLTIRLYPGPDDDLLRWLAGMEGQPYGAKSQAVKEALRRGLGMNSPAAPAGAAVDLAEIRAVVEAAVEAALARLEGAVIARPAPDSADDEAERLLDALGEALVL
jgi:hypothetical protein